MSIILNDFSGVPFSSISSDHVSWLFYGSWVSGYTLKVSFCLVGHHKMFKTQKEGPVLFLHSFKTLWSCKGLKYVHKYSI